MNKFNDYLNLFIDEVNEYAEGVHKLNKGCQYRFN